MMIDNNGRVAFHALLFTDSGGVDFVQYDFDGKELYRSVYKRPSQRITDCKYV